MPYQLLIEGFRDGLPVGRIERAYASAAGAMSAVQDVLEHAPEARTWGGAVAHVVGTTGPVERWLSRVAPHPEEAWGLEWLRVADSPEDIAVPEGTVLVRPSIILKIREAPRHDDPEGGCVCTEGTCGWCRRHCAECGVELASPVDIEITPLCDLHEAMAF